MISIEDARKLSSKSHLERLIDRHIRDAAENGSYSTRYFYLVCNDTEKREVLKKLEQEGYQYSLKNKEGQYMTEIAIHWN